MQMANWIPGKSKQRTFTDSWLQKSVEIIENSDARVLGTSIFKNDNSIRAISLRRKV